MVSVPQNKTEWLDTIRLYQSEAAAALEIVNNQSENILGRAERSGCRAYSWPGFTYVDNSWNWGSRDVHHHYASPQVREQDEASHEKKKEYSTATKVAAVMVTLFAAFTVGYFYSRFEGYSENYSRTNAIFESAKTTLSELNEPGNNQAEPNAKKDAFTALVDLFSFQNKIDKDNYQAAKYDLLSGVMLLSGSALLAAGTCAAAPIAVTAGSVTTVASSVLFLLNKGLHFNDSRKHNEARRSMVLPKSIQPGSSLSLADDAHNRVDVLSENMEVTEYEQVEGQPLFDSKYFAQTFAPSAPEGE